jgi:hypothetical protein
MEIDNINEKCEKYAQKHILDYINKTTNQEIRA